MKFRRIQILHVHTCTCLPSCMSPLFNKKFSVIVKLFFLKLVLFNLSNLHLYTTPSYCRMAWASYALIPIKWSKWFHFAFAVLICISLSIVLFLVLIWHFIAPLGTYQIAHYLFFNRIYKQTVFWIIRPIYVAPSNGLQGATAHSAATARNTWANPFSLR